MIQVQIIPITVINPAIQFSFSQFKRW